MGLFSGISRALFGDPGRGIREARDAQLGFQQQGLDYMMESNAPMLAARNQGLGVLSSYMDGGEGQNQFIEDVKSSPLYSQMIQSGQEGVLADAGNRGLTRSGNTAMDLNSANQNVLNSLVNKRLGIAGNLSGFNPGTGAIASTYNSMGRTAGNAGMAEVNADQAQGGQLMNLITAGVGAAASDRRLKKNIVNIGMQNGIKTYSWDWNEKAKDSFGLVGKGFGVIAQEVERFMPQAVVTKGGYKHVLYKMIGVNHG